MLTPTGRRVIFEPDAKPDEEVSKGGIILPPERWSLHPDTTRGIVISVGPKCIDAKVGQIILISRLAGVKIDMDDKKYLMIDEEDIIATVEE